MIERLAVAAADIEQVGIARYDRGHRGRHLCQVDKNSPIPAARVTRQPRAEKAANCGLESADVVIQGHDLTSLARGHR